MKSVRAMLLGVSLLIFGIFLWLFFTLPSSFGIGEIAALLLILFGFIQVIAVFYINKHED